MRKEGLGNSELDSQGKRKLTSHSELIKAWCTGQLGVCSVASAVTQMLQFSMGGEEDLLLVGS